MGSNPARFERLTRRGGDPPALAQGSLHLYRVLLEAHQSRAGSLAPLLSAEETARAGRFRFPGHRRRYILAHGILREILSRYAGCGPETLRFSEGPHGKPSLSPAVHSLCFNISHSDQLALIAVARECEVGVDTEPVKTLHDARPLMAAYFPAEMAEMPPEASDEAVSHRFLRCWTRHEAVLKATGAGLTGGVKPTGREHVDTLVPAAGHIAAVASLRPLPDRRLIDVRGGGILNE